MIRDEDWEEPDPLEELDELDELAECGTFGEFWERQGSEDCEWCRVREECMDVCSYTDDYEVEDVGDEEVAE